jgi:cytochrome c oxidase subunit II
VIGRTNESWMQFDREGTFYGQCNQICGLNHPFMPIEIDVLSKADFDKWAAQAKQKFAQGRPSQPVEAASNAAGGLTLAAAAQ